MTGWFYLDDGRRTGPVSEAELSALFRSGRLPADASVQTEGEASWSRLDERLLRVVGGPPPEAPDLSPPADARWQDTAPHPWRRYFARAVDASLVGVVVVLPLMAAAYVVSPGATATLNAILVGPAGAAFGIFLTAVAAIPVNALAIGLTGFTPGKWIFGVKVVGPDAGPIGMAAAFRRELGVWLRGLGLGLPLISLLTMIGSYQGLVAKRHAPWDPPAERVVVHRPLTPAWRAAMVVAVLAWIGEKLALQLLAAAG